MRWPFDPTRLRRQQQRDRAPMSSRRPTRPSAVCPAIIMFSWALSRTKPPPKSVSMAPRGERVDADAARAELLREIARQHLDATLHRRIGRVARRCEAGQARRDVQNTTSSKSPIAFITRGSRGLIGRCHAGFLGRGVGHELHGAHAWRRRGCGSAAEQPSSGNSGACQCRPYSAAIALQTGGNRDQIADRRRPPAPDYRAVPGRSSILAIETLVETCIDLRLNEGRMLRTYAARLING